MKKFFLLSIMVLACAMSVHADVERTVWEGNFDSGNWSNQLQVSGSLFSNLSSGDKVKFYAYEYETGNGQIQIMKSSEDIIKDNSNTYFSVSNTFTYNVSNDNDANWFKSDFYLKGQYYNLYRITIIKTNETINEPTGGYAYSTDKTDWWLSYGDVAMNSDNWDKTVNITPASGTNVVAGGKITIACQKGNNAQIKIQYSGGTYITHGGYEENGQGEKDLNNYFTFTVPSDYATHINNNENIQIKGKDFTITSVYYTAPAEGVQNYLIDKNLTYSELSYEIESGGGETMNNWSARGVVIKGNNVATGNVLRILLSNTSVASYACLKTGSDWHEIMTGADKFSIADWKYIDITINDKLRDMLNSSTIDGGLRVNGIGYTFAGAYVISAGLTDTGTTETWSDGAVVSTFNQTAATTATVPGEYFRKAGDGNGDFGRSIDNTKNNIVRVTFSEDGTTGGWLKAWDKTDAVTINNKTCHAYYTRRRDGDNEYYNSINFSGNTATFPMSDVIAYFRDNADNDIIDMDGDNGDKGTKQGMLSDVTQNGMVLQSDKSITKVELVGAMTAKYVRGYAEFSHSLSASYWKPITLPYNLTPEQFHNTFGKNAMICEIGGSSTVTKKLEPNKSGEETIGIKGSTVATIAFVDAIYDRMNNTTYERVADTSESGWKGYKVKNVRANYPYIIHLDGEKNASYREGTATDKSDFQVEGLRADVRDFKSYKFRSNNFKYEISVDEAVETYLDNLSSNNPTKYNQLLSDFKIKKDGNDYVLADDEKNTYDNAYMYFISTAPVFNIRNENEKDIVEYYNPEIAGDVNEYTSITQTGSTTGAQNYYFYQGVLSPIANNKTVKLKYGLGYLEFSKALIDLANAGEQQVSDGSTNAKGISMLFGEIIETEKAESETTDIKTVFRPKAISSGKVFSLSGQCVSINGIAGLPKGIYIMDGKKISLR